MSTESRTKCKDLILGTAGIYIIYCLASLLQQYIMKTTYIHRYTKQPHYFLNSNAFVLIPAAVSWVYGIAIHRNVPPQKRTYIPHKNMFYCGLLIVVTSLAFTKAIYLTSFPIVMMFKSCNILTVITIGVFCSRVRQKQQKLTKDQMLTGLVVTAGLLLYYLGGSQQHKQKAFNLMGLFLLIVSLLCDGFLPDFQAQIKVKYKPTPLQMFEDSNKWKTIISLVYAVLSFQITEMAEFFYYHPLSLVHLIILGSLGAVGQMVVFWMIKLFRQHIVPFVITTRKISTTLISILFFKHGIQPLQMLGIAITFFIVIFDFYKQIKIGNKKDQSKPKVPYLQVKSAQVEPIIKNQQGNECVQTDSPANINSIKQDSQKQTMTKN